MAEIERSDLISDGAFEAPKELAAELAKIEAALDGIIDKGKDSQAELSQTKGIKDLTTKVGGLEKEQKKLIDSNNKLKDVQDKAAKSAENQAEAMDTLDGHMGGVITRAKEMGKQLMALAKNPFFLIIAAVVGTLAAATSAMKTFFNATGRGEDILSRQQAVWKQFFSVIKKGWSDVGESIVGANTTGQFSINMINNLLNAGKIVFPFLIGWLNEVQAEFNKTAAQADALAVLLDDIGTRSAENIMRRAETERIANEALLKAEDKINLSAAERLEFLERGLKAQQDQLKIDKQLAEDRAKALLYELGLERNLTKEQVEQMSWAELDNEFTGEQMERLAKAYAEVTMLDARYNTEVKRNQTKIIALREEIRKDQIASAKAAAEEEFKILKRSYDEQIILIERRAAVGEISYEQAEKEKYFLAVSNSEAIADAQINSIKKVLQLDILTTEERAALEQQLHDLKVKLSAEYFQLMKDGASLEVEVTRLKLEDIFNIYNNFTSAIGELTTSLTNNRLEELDREEQRLQEFYDREIELAADNEETKVELEKRREAELEKLDRKRIEAKRRQAIFDKSIAATQTAINTAAAIVKFLFDPGGFAGTALSIAAGVTGAVQVGAILARDIPQYEEGGVTKTPWSIVGEAGIERYKTPSGKVGFTPGTATLMKFPVGTEITSHDETMRDIALRGIGVSDTMASEGDIVDFQKFFSSLEETIRSKESVSINISKKGVETMIRDSNATIKILNDLFK